MSPETPSWAAREALGILLGPFTPRFMIEAAIRRFRAAWSHPEPPRIGATVGVLCLPDGKRARKLAKAAFEWFYRELLATVRPVLERSFPAFEH